jgi:hypothetical protein
MSNEKTIKALEELAKTEYSTATALDAALTDAADPKLRRNYRRWRDSHVEQAEALDARIKELGGRTTHHNFRDGTTYRIFWNLTRGSHDYKSLAGVRFVAGRGIKQYLDHLETIDDPRSLDVVRKNLEAKQSEMHWYDDQVVEEHTRELGLELAKTRDKAKKLEQEVKAERSGMPASPLAALVLILIIATVAFLISRRNEEPDEDPFADAFSSAGGDGAGPTESTAGI